MIKELGRVIKVDGEFAWVETSVKSSCSSCAAKGNCGTSAIAEAVAGKTVVNKVKNDLAVEVNDWVEIGIEEDTLLAGAFYLYVLPLLFAIITALVCQFWLAKFFPINEGLVILLTFAGGALGFAVSKAKLKAVEDSSSAVTLLEKKQSGIQVTEVQ